MKDYRKNNIHIKIPREEKMGCFLIVEDEVTKNTLAVTWEELCDIANLVDEIVQDNNKE